MTRHIIAIVDDLFFASKIRGTAEQLGVTTSFPRTADAVVEGRVDSISWDDACGAPALAGVMVVARRRGLTTRLLDLRSSGDTGGPRQRVVGYGAFAVAR